MKCERLGSFRCGSTSSSGDMETFFFSAEAEPIGNVSGNSIWKSVKNIFSPDLKARICCCAAFYFIKCGTGVLV